LSVSSPGSETAGADLFDPAAKLARLPRRASLPAQSVFEDGQATLTHAAASGAR